VKEDGGLAAPVMRHPAFIQNLFFDTGKFVLLKKYFYTNS